MAKRKRRSFGLGAVAKHGSQYRGYSTHTLRVCVKIFRNRGASTKGQYQALAASCTKGRRLARDRFGTGIGRTPTAATKKALRAFATKVK